MTIAVLDGGRELKAFGRSDGAMLVTIQFAIGKAYTACSMNRTTDMLAQRTWSGGDLHGLETAHSPALVPIGGGAPLRASGQLVGAVGVSGGTPARITSLLSSSRNSTKPAICDRNHRDSRRAARARPARGRRRARVRRARRADAAALRRHPRDAWDRARPDARRARRGLCRRRLQQDHRPGRSVRRDGRPGATNLGLGDRGGLRLVGRGARDHR